jgi:phenylalanyl-tRNA synthetase alpha chain
MISRIQETKSLKELDDVRIALLGKNGELTQALKNLGTLSPEEKKEKGQELNRLKNEIQSSIDNQRLILIKQEMQERIESERIDVTLPGISLHSGAPHLLTRVMNDITSFFTSLGFDIQDGPEIEDEFHNFDALNVPKHHPARQSQDTFYLNGGLLRTHTSNVQIRTLKNNKPPLRMMSVGRVYRNDSLDATHTPMFHQVEGMVIEDGIHMGHLKGILLDFFKYFFEKDKINLRFRPSFFPFTEPSAEVDIACRKEKGKLIFGEGDQWIEVLGCGMTHPQVYKNCGHEDPLQGIAFGMGVERLLMLKYGISDIRTLYENDIRFLKGYA